MANAPLLKQLELTGKRPELRAINNEYFSELIANQNKQLLQFKAAEMRLQAEAAVRMVRGLEEIADQQAASNRLMDSMSGSLESIADSAHWIVGQLDQIDDTLQSGFSEVQELSSTASPPSLVSSPALSPRCNSSKKPSLKYR